LAQSLIIFPVLGGISGSKRAIENIKYNN